MMQTGFPFPPVNTDGIRQESHGLDMTQATITGGFWRDYQKQMICITIPHIIAQLEYTDYQNVLNTARMHRNAPHNPHNRRPFWSDSFVYEAAESMAWALMIDPLGDPEIIDAQNVIRGKLLQWIPNLADSQNAEGYLGTLWLLGANPPERPRMYDLANAHELYNMGFFMEAAVAVHRATGSKEMLKAAIRIVDYLTRLIGDGAHQFRMQPGHPEIEEAMLRLADHCALLGSEYAPYVGKCRNLVTWLLVNRGTDRDWHGTPQDNWHVAAKPILQLMPEDLQGQHTDRAGYLYQILADWGKLNGDHRYDALLLSLYNAVTSSRTYITGGSGFTGASGLGDLHEAWGPANMLPNDQDRCCETCSAMTLIYWSKSMHLLFGDSAYYDTIEQALYNTTLSQLSQEGNAFFYHQVLQSLGNKRKEWLGCPCCPVNYTRLVSNLSRYLYSHTEDSIFVNLYISSTAKFSVGAHDISLKMESSMPWSGAAMISVGLDRDAELTVNLRVPAWASGKTAVKVNGVSVSTIPGEKGYISIRRIWHDTDQIVVDFTMEILRVYTPNVLSNAGFTAIQRGPVVYCAEAVDNVGIPLDQVWIPGNAALKAHAPSPLPHPVGIGIHTRPLVTVTTEAYMPTSNEVVPCKLTLIPYFAWANRAIGRMQVFLREIPEDEN